MSRIARRLQKASGVSASVGAALNLPRVAWEGGPSYWNQFSMAASAGWNNPSFFPIGIDSAPFSSTEEVQWDKAHGVNFYVGGLSQWVPWTLLVENDMYYVGDKFNSVYDGQMPDNFPNLVGYRLGDETDGIYPNPQDGYDFLNGLIADYGNRSDGRFMYNNYTQMCVTDSWAPKEQYINNFTDATSLDMYWYTIPDSSFTSHGAYVSSVGGPTSNRRGTSYGAMVRGLRQVDDMDSKKQPIWMFIENLYGGPGDNEDPTKFVRYITPEEIKSAVMGSIISEARGILWFNSAMNAPADADKYPVGNVIRAAQVTNNFFGAAQVQAMGEVNLQVQRLAPIINTQSYVWTFGPNLETMLKTYNGYAYVFAMISNSSAPGSRTFTLPAGITGPSVTVVDESRSLTVSGGTFTDTFVAEYSYHIYKIAL